MANRMPSMVALLGLLAVAGYQNRDKLSSVLGGLAGPGGSDPSTSVQPERGVEGIMGRIGDLIGGAGAGGIGAMLSGGLGDLVERFNESGQGSKTQSWVSVGDNETIGTSELEQTLGSDTLQSLQQQTGLSKEEVLERLSKVLPDAVNRLTPAGRLPTEDEASRLL